MAADREQQLVLLGREPSGGCLLLTPSEEPPQAHAKCEQVLVIAVAQRARSHDAATAVCDVTVGTTTTAHGRRCTRYGAISWWRASPTSPCDRLPTTIMSACSALAVSATARA